MEVWDEDFSITSRAGVMEHCWLLTADSIRAMAIKYTKPAALLEILLPAAATIGEMTRERLLLGAWAISR